jgi:hypothetical protein
MSIKAMQTVLDESKQKGSILLLLLVLANYAHDDGTYAFPSVDTMARYTRLKKRNVYLLLNKLKESGELAEMGIHNSGTVIYRIVLPGLTGGGVKFTSPKSTGVQPRSRGGDRGDTGGVIPAAPDPSSNHQQPSEDAEGVKRRLADLYRLLPQAAWERTTTALHRGDPDAATLRARVESAISEAKRRR